MKWIPHTERPGTNEPSPALIAAPDEEGQVYLVGIFMWRGGRWEDEMTGRAMRETHYWWVLESELIAEVPT